MRRTSQARYGCLADDILSATSPGSRLQWMAIQPLVVCSDQQLEGGRTSFGHDFSKGHRSDNLAIASIHMVHEVSILAEIRPCHLLTAIALCHWRHIRPASLRARLASQVLPQLSWKLDGSYRFHFVFTRSGGVYCFRSMARPVCVVKFMNDLSSFHT